MRSNFSFTILFLLQRYKKYLNLKISFEFDNVSFITYQNKIEDSLPLGRGPFHSFALSLDKIRLHSEMQNKNEFFFCHFTRLHYLCKCKPWFI